MIEFNKKNIFTFNQAGITCLIKRVLDDDVEQYYVHKIQGLSLYDECCIRPLYDEGMFTNSLYMLLDNLYRLAEAKIRSLEFNRKTDNICQTQQYVG